METVIKIFRKYMKNNQLLLTGCIALFSCPALPSAFLSAQDSLPVTIRPYAPKVYYFPFDRWDLLRDYRGNLAMFESLDSLLCIPWVVAGIDTIQVVAGCSPSGSEEYNQRLAQRRAESMRAYLLWKHRAVAGSHPLVIKPVGIDHEGYEVLRRSGRGLTEKQMWDLLQYAGVHLKMKDGGFIHSRPDSPLLALLEDSLASRVLITGIAEASPGFPGHLLPSGAVPDPLPIAGRIQSVKPKSFPPFALKTNLLYDLAMLPNLTFETYLGKGWSIALEGNWSWWVFGSPVWKWDYHRIQAAGVELRKWIGSRQPLQGHAAGLYVMGGTYDIRLSAKDEISRGWLSNWSRSAGISYGYSFPVSGNLGLEFGIAAGYVGGTYYDYDYCTAHRHWRWLATKKRNYWGITRVEVSLAYRFGKDK
jgi:hypothetical protein